MWFTPQIDIALISLGFGIISQIMTHTLLDKRAMKQNQQAMKDKQKQFQKEKEFKLLQMAEDTEY